MLCEEFLARQAYHLELADAVRSLSIRPIEAAGKICPGPKLYVDSRNLLKFV